MMPRYHHSDAVLATQLLLRNFCYELLATYVSDEVPAERCTMSRNRDFLAALMVLLVIQWAALVDAIPKKKPGPVTLIPQGMSRRGKLLV